jgi:signal transduction histidine kinase
VDFVGYTLLTNSIKTSHEKDTQILFYKIKSDVDAMLSRLLYEYTKQKDILENKHKEVLAYLNSSKNEDLLTLNLEQIHNQINQGLENKPYNIYISNKDYVIKNTTYKPDIDFNLSFAKKEFDEHFENNQIGVTTPIFKKSSKNFFSFTDSYLSKNKEGILQVSYNYSETTFQLQAIRKSIETASNIKDAKAYIIVNTGFINDLILKDFASYKPTLEEIENRIKEGKKINDELKDKIIYTNEFIQDNTNYRSLYFSTKSSIFDDTKVIFSILLDESEYYKKMENINYLMILITVIGLISIVIITLVRNKEMKLSFQDRFIQSAMHELKTPLSIITLNNDLKKEKYGEDEFTNQIDSAVKILHKSYEDMEFMIKKEKDNYKIEIIDLEEIVEDRIDYFKQIANMNKRELLSNINSECQVEISQVELIRLIDNNISNAIKYSTPNSTIEISLKENKLQFKNFGTPIKNSKKIFSKYYRENGVVGGYGLGLNIVKNIAKKYDIEFYVQTDEKNRNIFTYLFKSHFNDI